VSGLSHLRGDREPKPESDTYADIDLPGSREQGCSSPVWAFLTRVTETDFAQRSAPVSAETKCATRGTPVARAVLLDVYDTFRLEVQGSWVGECVT
jgi:hypothetical protein